MAKMNVNRARGGDDDFGDVGAEPTMPAKYAGTCATCGQRFSVGDPIAAVLADKKTTYHHAACRYPASALLAEHMASDDVEAVVAAGHGSVRCQAATKKGEPCNNMPQRGEQFCGPHLSQRAVRPSSSRPLTTRSDADDAPF
jgi:hypothetical protein